MRSVPSHRYRTPLATLVHAGSRLAPATKRNYTDESVRCTRRCAGVVGLTTQADVLRRQATDGEHQNAEWLNQRLSRRSSPDTSKALLS
jgi:microsomal dipeptidase-like Zn-dependent dipeptidase